MNMRNLFLTLAFGLCSGVFAQNTGSVDFSWG